MRWTTRCSPASRSACATCGGASGAALRAGTEAVPGFIHPRISSWNENTAPDSPMTMSTDRKSTRLNSSHLVISYAVFCLKKKKRIVSSMALTLREHAEHLTVIDLDG